MADEDWKLFPDVPGLISKAPGAPPTLVSTAQPLMSQDTPPADDWVQPPGDGFGEAETGSSDDQSDATTAEANAMTWFMRKQGQSGGQPPVIASGANYAGVDGKERFGAAYDTAPALAAQGMGETAQATGDEADALAAHYKKQSENAAIMAADVQRRREQDDQELRRREAELKDTTAKYSQDLADTGKFWTKPSSILSAIAFTLAPLGSDDPTIGIRLLDNAIQNDLKNRKELANMHLGELRSNLSGYRQIAKDRESGDMLAQSEAYRIAALQVEQIGQSFKGQKAKSAMKVMVADLMQKANISAMEAYRRLIYMGPQVVSPQMAKELYAQPGFQVFGTEGQKRAQAAEAAQQSGAAQVPGATVQPNQVAGTAPPSVPGPPPEGKPGAKPGTPGFIGPPEASRSEFEKFMGQGAAGSVEARSPGAARRLSTLDNLLTLKAVRLLGSRAHSEDDIVKKKAEILFGTDGKSGITSQIPEIEKSLQKDIEAISGYSRLQQDVRDLEAAAGGDTAKLNAFLGPIRNFAPGAQQEFEDLMSKMNVGSKQRRLARDAAIRFRQVLGGNVNTYFKDTSGSAVNAAEGGRLKQLISMGSPWVAIKAFSEKLSAEKAAKFNMAVRSAVQDPIASELFLIRMGQQHPLLNSAGKKKSD